MELTQTDLRDLRRLAGIMVPSSTDYGVPAASDDIIFADIVRSLGRDRNQVRAALASLGDLAEGAFAELDESKAKEVAFAMLSEPGPMVTALGRAVLQCYYRDDRVIAALGLEPRPPFPKGYALEQGDWSLLDAVKRRPKMWRDVGSGG